MISYIEQASSEQLFLMLCVSTPIRFCQFDPRSNRGLEFVFSMSLVFPCINILCILMKMVVRDEELTKSINKRCLLEVDTIYIICILKTLKVGILSPLANFHA